MDLPTFLGVVVVVALVVYMAIFIASVIGWAMFPVEPPEDTD